MPPPGSFFEYWKLQLEAFKDYWELYGRTWALVRSPYVHVALGLTIFCHWLTTGTSKPSDLAISVIPNLLGFSVGAMAIVLALSSATLFRTIAGKGRPDSYFMVLTTNLAHFILVQVFALLFGIMGKLTEQALLESIALFFLFYAVLVVLSTGIQLFQTAKIYNAAASLPPTCCQKPTQKD